jgi:DNA ligase-1
MKQCPSDLLAVVYLCINKLAPTWDGIELGVGESLLIKAIAESTGRTTQKIKADLQTRGDLGSVAQSSRGNQMQVFKPKPLTVRGTFKVLKEIATISGNSSMQRKVDKIRTLLVACKDTEAKYLIRALEGKLRIGLAEQTVLSALAQASFAFHEGVETISECNGSDLQKSIETLKQVYNELPTYEIVVPYLLEHGFQNILENCKMTPGN